MENLTLNNPTITVLGSANKDTFIVVERTPEVGETISASNIKFASGGKGANQAATVGKLDHPVNFICQTGRDDAGESILSELAGYNVNTKYVNKLAEHPTGQAFILSFPNKDNSIIIIGGANSAWSDQLNDSFDDLLGDSKFLLMQREIPDRINILASKAARSKGITTILDMGGNDLKLDSEFLSLIDIVSPNKTELKRILTKDINFDNEDELIQAVNEMRTISNNPNLKLLLKLGSKGCLYVNEKNEIIKQSAFHFEDIPIIDTTGAG